jgi:hypothetical protein
MVAESHDVFHSNMQLDRLSSIAAFGQADKTSADALQGLAARATRYAK